MRRRTALAILAILVTGLVVGVGTSADARRARCRGRSAGVRRCRGVDRRPVMPFPPRTDGTIPPSSTTTSSTTSSTTSTTAPPTTAPPTTAPPPPPPPSSTGRYDVGTPTLTDLWVDPVAGNDENDGRSPARAFRTIRAAWDRGIPAGTLAGTGYRIRLQPGAHHGGWYEGRHGTHQYPIVIEPAAGALSATIDENPNFFDCSYVYVQDVRVTSGGGDGVHFAFCDHVLLRRSTVTGVRRDAHEEAIKVNQSQYVYIEDSDISGAGDNPIDFVAVQYGHVIANRLHNANGWCLYTKGGSAYLRVDGNEVYDCGHGISAGEGAGFEFFVAPWLHYHAYDVKVTNNVVHDVEGAGLGVYGGYDILMAYNTLVRVGRRSHVIEVVHGGVGCDGDTAACRARMALGGWGSDTEEGQYLPNRHVFIYDNVVYNPAGHQSAWQHFEIRHAATPPPGTHAPNPSYADDDLRLRGNLIWNGGPSMPLGLDGPLADDIRAGNTINTVEPTLGSGWRLGNLDGVTTYTAPDFGWSDAPTTPDVRSRPGTAANSVPLDRAGEARVAPGRPGAYR